MTESRGLDKKMRPTVEEHQLDMDGDIGDYCPSSSRVNMLAEVDESSLQGGMEPETNARTQRKEDNNSFRLEHSTPLGG